MKSERTPKHEDAHVGLTKAGGKCRRSYSERRPTTSPMWTTRPVCFKMWSSVARHSFEKSSKPWKLNEQKLTHAAKVAFWESEVVDIPECTSINRGEEVELDADPAVVVVLALI